MVALPQPRIIDINSVPVLKWGIVGTNIANRFVHALHAYTTQRAVAVTARDAAKTAAFADTHGIGAVYPTLDELLADASVDVVYISTPHPLHHDQALKAIAAGKHVLIEKPIAMSAVEASEILAAGRAAGLLVMEAMWTRYLPQSDVMRQVLAAGTLGEVKLVTADFGFVMPYQPEHRLWNPELGGGALLDAGVYPISFASSVLGAPRTVVVTGETGPGGVDTRADMLLTMPGGTTALLSTSLVTALPARAGIYGSKGRLEITPPFYGPTGLTITLGRGDDEERDEWNDENDFEQFHDGLSCQATAFASYVAAGLTESPVHPHSEIISVMATIDEARKQVTAQG